MRESRNHAETVVGLPKIRKKYPQNIANLVNALESVVCYRGPVVGFVMVLRVLVVF